MDNKCGILSFGPGETFAVSVSAGSEFIALILYGYLLWKHSDYLRGKIMTPLVLINVFQITLLALTITNLPLKYLNKN